MDMFTLLTNSRCIGKMLIDVIDDQAVCIQVDSEKTEEADVENKKDESDEVGINDFPLSFWNFFYSRNCLVRASRAPALHVGMVGKYYDSAITIEKISIRYR